MNNCIAEQTQTDAEWKKESDRIKAYYRNIISLITRNGAYFLGSDEEAVYQYLEGDGNEVGHKIYQYLHGSETFISLQTDMLGLYQGVLTYLGPEGRYVYLCGGEADFTIDSKLDRKNNILPSFLMRQYAYVEGQGWEDIDGKDRTRPRFRFYNRLKHAIQKEQVWNNSKIVKFFNFEIDGKRVIKAGKSKKTIFERTPLTHFEIKNQALVIPSGEIDFKVLASILIDQRQGIADELTAGKSLLDCSITPPAVHMRKRVILPSEREEIKQLPRKPKPSITFDKIVQKAPENYVFRSKNVYTFEDPRMSLEVYFRMADYEPEDVIVSKPDSVTIAALLERFGVNDATRQLTERGKRIHDWLVALNEHKVYTVLFEPKTPPEVYANFFETYTPREADMGVMLEFVWNWVNLKNGTEYLLDSFEQFQESTICMIDLRTHYFIRLTSILTGHDNLPIPSNTASRGWVVFPVLYSSNVSDEKNQLKNKVSGLFMGHFRDIDKHGRGYVEHGLLPKADWDDTNHKYVENSTAEFLKDYITRLKLVIRPLAQIENAEVIHKRIAKEKIDFEANKSIVANIFSRNIAHSIGSHIVPRVESSLLYKTFGIDLETLAYDVTKESIAKYSERVAGYAKRIKYVNSLKKILEGYLNERQEFIADISPISFPMNAKGYFYRDIVLPFVENKLLTAYIARSEGVGFDTVDANCSLQIRVYRNYGKVDPKTKQKLGYEFTAFYPLDGTTPDYRYPNTKDGENFPFYINLPVQSPSITYEDFLKDKVIKAVSLADGTISADKDVMIALPSHLGQHAFYSILENIIRNSAKNQLGTINTRTFPKLTIHISIDDLENSAQGRAASRRGLLWSDDYYSIRVWDDVTKFDVDDLKLIKKWQRERNRALALIYTKAKPHKVTLSETEEKRHFFMDFDDRIKNSEPKDNTEGRNPMLGLDDIRVSALILGGGMTKYHERAFSVARFEQRFLNVGLQADPTHPYFFYSLRAAKPKSFLFCSSTPLTNHHDSIVEVNSVTNFKGLAKCNFCLINGDDIKEDGFEELIREHSFTLPNRLIVYNITNPLRQALLRKMRLSFTPENLQAETFIAPTVESFERLSHCCWKIWLSRWTAPDEGEEQFIFMYTNKDTVAAPKASADGPVLWQNSPDKLVHIQPDDFNLFYSRHNKLLTSDLIQRARKSDGSFFYQNIDKNSLDFSRLYHWPANEFERELLAYRMAEAGLFRILVLDERIAELTVSQASQVTGWSALEVYKAQNIYVCTSLKVDDTEIPMPTSTNRGEGVRLEIASPNRLSCSCVEGLSLPGQFDAILIHRSKLNLIKEKLVCTDEEIIKMLRESFPLLVINTGGGGKGILGLKANYFPHAKTMTFFQEKWFPKVAFTEQIVG